MTSPGVSPRTVVLYSAMIHGWILGMSYALKFLFGAAMTGGWLLIGIMLSVVLFGMVLMLKELFSAVDEPPNREPRFTRQVVRRGRPETQGRLRNTETHALSECLESTQSYRAALGLAARHAALNRRKARSHTRGRRPSLPINV